MEKCDKETETTTSIASILEPVLTSLELYRTKNILHLLGRRNKENAQIQISFNAKTTE